ncbi:AAA domain-containing protein [Hugenholtzia roseola]|uniref:AAA domain-containing protein n=1 Tax=Hugenholtzia roseola TaxID=1002 RepID=UPI0003FEC4F5|nr:AAA domain-containing protein [Hugenholtzia roseola]
MTTPFTDTRQELRHLKELLKIEQEADKAQYQEKMLNAPLAKRRKDGLCWYPLRLISEQLGVGGRWIIEVERKADKGQPHQLQTGSVVTFFNVENGKEANQSNGVVGKLQGDVMQVVLNQDEPPQWVSAGQIGVYLAFDDSTYREMNFALRNVIEAENNRLAELREILLGYKKATFDEAYQNSTQYQVYVEKVTRLNDSQNQAVANLVYAKDVAIIHGPPGTGKTTTLVAAIEAILKREKQVLVCAPSNTAVDWLVEKIHAQGISVTRLGHPARVSETLEHLTLDAKIESHQDYRSYKEMMKKAEALKREALRFRRNFGAKERQERQFLLREAQNIKNEALRLEDYLVHKIFDHSRVIACTLTTASSYILKNKTFSSVFIDEAGQALEPAMWIAVQKGHKIFMAGDHQQLPPTVKSLEAARAGLENTLFEKTIARQQVDRILQVQYRMHEQIMAFSNQKFYQNKLEAAPANRYHTLFKNDKPVLFIDTAGTGFAEKQDEETLSRYNPDEAHLLLRILGSILNEVENDPMAAAQIYDLSIGIISPYKAQVYFLKDHILDHDALKPHLPQITIQTVDGFQGQERDLMLISLVRSNEKGEIGFLADLRRFNVAITRAKKKLVVIGDSATLATHPFFADFIKYSENIEAYQSAWEWWES